MQTSEAWWKTIPPATVVIFGGAGDLARRKLLPALFRLMAEHGLDDRISIVGTARSSMTSEAYQQIATEALADAGLGERAPWCRRVLSYAPMGELVAHLDALEASRPGPVNRLLYLATPAGAFPGLIETIAESGLSDGSGWSRLVIEKPFGLDAASGADLDTLIHRHFDEGSVFRIDHYLGKETVQNLLVFRFGNPLFESSWGRDRVRAVQITVAESIGTTGRTATYDASGAVRDIVQNHLAQLLSLTAMEPPIAFGQEEIRDEKVKVLKAIRTPSPGDIVLGRYVAGSIDGETAIGYLDEEGVPPESHTETFAAMRLWVDTWRWRGVPFVVRTGKRLPQRSTEIAIAFHEPPVTFHGRGQGNVLRMRLQPEEGFSLSFDVKTPGPGMEVQTEALTFSYADTRTRLPDAYETLLAEALRGDQTLFVRDDEVAEAWRIVTPALPGAPDRPVVLSYPAGTWGPAEADDLTGPDGWY